MPIHTELALWSDAPLEGFVGPTGAPPCDPPVCNPPAGAIALLTVMGARCWLKGSTTAVLRLHSCGLDASPQGDEGGAEGEAEGEAAGEAAGQAVGKVAGEAEGEAAGEAAGGAVGEGAGGAEGEAEGEAEEGGVKGEAEGGEWQSAEVDSDDERSGGSSGSTALPRVTDYLIIPAEDGLGYICCLLSPGAAAEALLEGVRACATLLEQKLPSLSSSGVTVVPPHDSIVSDLLASRLAWGAAAFHRAMVTRLTASNRWTSSYGTPPCQLRTDSNTKLRT